jgi:uncharacterized protein (TIGR00251 family)
MQELQAYLERVLLKRRFFVVVKANSDKNLIVCFDGVLRVNIKAPAYRNKANIELVRFLSRQLRPCRIVSGFSSRRKLMEFTD